MSIYLKDIKELVNKINHVSNIIKRNQLFINLPPPYELVVKILNLLLNKDLDENIYYEFSRKQILNKNIVSKIQIFIPELKKYYLNCKQKKYLENLNEKKVITLFRQILKNYNYVITSTEKYENSEKYLLYTITKKKNRIIKKVNSTINFD
jgi:hypothetical protein